MHIALHVDRNHQLPLEGNAKEDGNTVKAAEQEFRSPAKIEIIDVKCKRC